MAIGLIIAAVATGLVGVGSHLNAKDTNERVQMQSAPKMYGDCKSELEAKQKAAEESPVLFGVQKNNVSNHSMKMFLESHEKITPFLICQRKFNIHI